MKYAQLVMGPAGSGKSTYCHAMQQYASCSARTVNVVNLDPAAETFLYDPIVDVRELISVSDVAEDEQLRLGPNGALVYCMEYLVEHTDWLLEQLDASEDEYFLFDCPGQIELYSHLPVMRQLVDALKAADFAACAVFLIDTNFVLDAEKFISGALTALSCMISLETSAVNVLTKWDLLSADQRSDVERFLELDTRALLDDAVPAGSDDEDGDQQRRLPPLFGPLTEAIATILDDYSMVKFVALDANDEESVEEVMLTIDMTIGYGETLEVRDRFPGEREDDDDVGGADVPD